MLGKFSTNTNSAPMTHVNIISSTMTLNDQTESLNKNVSATSSSAVQQGDNVSSSTCTLPVMIEMKTYFKSKVTSYNVDNQILHQQKQNEKNLPTYSSVIPTQTGAINFKSNDKLSFQSCNNDVDQKILIQPQNNKKDVISMYIKNIPERKPSTLNLGENKSIFPSINNDKNANNTAQQNNSLKMSDTHMPIYSKDKVQKKVNKYLLQYHYRIMKNKSHKNKIRSPWDDLNTERFKLIASIPKRKIHIVDSKPYVKKKVINSLPYKKRSLESNAIIKKPKEYTFERFDYVSIKNTKEKTENETSKKISLPRVETQCTRSRAKETTDEIKSKKQMSISSSNQNTILSTSYRLKLRSSKLRQVVEKDASTYKPAKKQKYKELQQKTTKHNIETQYHTIEKKKKKLRKIVTKNSMQESKELMTVISKAKKKKNKSKNNKCVVDKKLQNQNQDINKTVLPTFDPIPKLNNKQTLQEEEFQKNTPTLRSQNKSSGTKTEKNASLEDDSIEEISTVSDVVWNNRNSIENLSSTQILKSNFLIRNKYRTSLNLLFYKKYFLNPIATNSKPFMCSIIASLPNLSSNVLKQMYKPFMYNGLKSRFFASDLNGRYFSIDMKSLNLSNRNAIQFNTGSNNNNEEIKITEIDNNTPTNSRNRNTALAVLSTKGKSKEQLEIICNSVLAQKKIISLTQPQKKSNDNESTEIEQNRKNSKKNLEEEIHLISLRLKNIHITNKKELFSQQTIKTNYRKQIKEKSKKSRRLQRKLLFFGLKKKQVIFYKIRSKSNILTNKIIDQSQTILKKKNEIKFSPLDSSIKKRNMECTTSKHNIQEDSLNSLPAMSQRIEVPKLLKKTCSGKLNTKNIINDVGKSNKIPNNSSQRQRSKRTGYEPWYQNSNTLDRHVPFDIFDYE